MPDPVIPPDRNRAAVADDGRPVLLGITERLEFVDASSHVEDLERYRARGYAIAGNRSRIVTDRTQSAVEVHKPSVNRVNLAGAAAGNGVSRARV